MLSTWIGANLVVLLVIGGFLLVTPLGHSAENLVIVTLDGFRSHEVFGGVDPLIAKDDRFDESNVHLANPNENVLEFFDRQPALNGKVAAFGAWKVFDQISISGEVISRSSPGLRRAEETSHHPLRP